MTHTPLALTLRTWSQPLGLLVFLIACTVFIGWAFKITALKSLFPHIVPMNPMTAICFACLSVSLLCHIRSKDGHCNAGQFLGAVVVAVTLVKFAEFFTGWQMGIDDVLFTNDLLTNQMAPNTTFNLFLLGIAAIINPFSKRWHHPSEYLILIVILTSFFAIVGYIYNITSFTQTASFYTPMALNTAFTFLILCTANLFARPDFGLMRTITGSGLGSVTVRRLLPIAILIPLLISILRLMGQRQGFYGTEFGTGLFTVSIIFIFGIMIWRNAYLLNRIDEERLKAEEEKMEAARLKSEFASTVSHELRTPLTVIKGGIDLMADGVLGEVNADQKDILATIKSNVDRLSRLINDVLDYQKLESQRMKFTLTEEDLNQVVGRVAIDFTGEIEKKGLSIKKDIPGHAVIVMCDKDKIIQVMFNFLSNAVKFCEKGTITVRVEKIEDNFAKVSVIDQGGGIKEEDKAKLFQSFSQLSTLENRKTGGTGLGLSICKKIIEAHGGKVGMDSIYGLGSTFYFTLKCKG